MCLAGFISEKAVGVKAIKPEYHTQDVLIIGAGGAGLRAAIAASQSDLSVAVLSKVQPQRSHTMAAQGGISAALGNRGKDDWRWHMYDTVRGSDWLGDQDAIARLCQKAPEAIKELADWGVPFTRDENGNIYQRAYGGQTVEFGKAPAYRACAAEDRTGQAIMQTLISKAKAQPVHFFNEFFALDLLMENGKCVGATAWDMATGTLHVFQSQVTILATGGYGQVYSSTTAAFTCTGDGNAMVLRAGLPLMDMEFVQFHPTGLYGTGILITEGARGEGAFLLNNKGERFMERYAPNAKDLASRDVIARAMLREIQEGRGCGDKRDYLMLDMRGLSEDIWQNKLPYIDSLVKMVMKLDPRKDLVPVIPTVHYTMGGIPTNVDNQVMDANGDVVGGLMAIGEAACNSIHGANRLGCNSLLDLMVFGKDAGEWAVENLRHTEIVPKVKQATIDKAFAWFDNIISTNGHLSAYAMRKQIQETMSAAAPIFRNDETMASGMKQLASIAKHYHDALGLRDKTLVWNNELVGALETKNLLLQAIATMRAAYERKESRGAHYREDFPKRDDEHWLKHSLVNVSVSGESRYGSKEVRKPEAEEPYFAPEARVY